MSDSEHSSDVLKDGLPSPAPDDGVAGGEETVGGTCPSEQMGLSERLRSDTVAESAEPVADADASLQKALDSLDLETYRQLVAKAEERDRFWDELLRAKAEVENVRKRMMRERVKGEEMAVRQFLSAILPIVDNVERALSSPIASDADIESFCQGIAMIAAFIKKTLSEHGVEEIDALDAMFDPDIHEAVAELEVEDRETGEIIDVQQKGYLYKGVVVRPSRVIVARQTAR